MAQERSFGLLRTIIMVCAVSMPETAECGGGDVVEIADRPVSILDVKPLPSQVPESASEAPSTPSRAPAGGMSKRPQLPGSAINARAAENADAQSSAAAETGSALDDHDAADDLDKLLEMAENDVSKLVDVSVASRPPIVSTAAPTINTEVTTVSRQKSTIGKSPAAVFVITNEMIRRSGARSIPDALRMAPGVQVARIDSSKWAIGVRGFSGRFSNKLLVQIDGRTVYTPLFGGVFWDVQDVLLEDVDRIEIIRGPGATIWGANAVNGIINIITKATSETQGVYAEAGAGNHERGFASGRLGGKLGKDATFRLYGKWFERAAGGNLASPFSPLDNNHDDWRMLRSGGRVDWTPTCIDTLTVQTDYYGGESGRRNFYADPDPSLPTPSFRILDDDAHLAGGNILARWTHRLSAESAWSLQAYYDRTEREFQAAGFRADRDTIDLDWQYSLTVGDRHRLICGLGYRNTRDRLRDIPFVIQWRDDRRSDDLFSYFVQDEVELKPDRWFLTLGSKFQHNDYTGFEIQPTARLLYSPDNRHSMWAAVSRAVRTPTRAEFDLVANLHRQGPAFVRLFGTNTFDSEELTAYEVGYRAQVTDRFAWDMAGFFNQYDNITSRPLGPPAIDASFRPPILFVPATLGNSDSGQTYGFELFGSYEVNKHWRIMSSYSLTHFDIPFGLTWDNSNNQLYTQSSWDIGEHWHLDAVWRYVDSVKFNSAPSYNTTDLRLAWLKGRCEAAIVGRNLLLPQHQEFDSDLITSNAVTSVRREFYGMVSWRF